MKRKQILVLTLLVLTMSLLNCKTKAVAQKSSDDNQTALFGTKWVLIGSNGEVINNSNTELEQPFLKLTEEGNGAGGNDGCNVFGGSFTSKEKQHIEFSQMRATMRYCEGNVAGGNMMSALNSAKKYSITGGTLSLLDEAGAVLASFKATSDQE